MGKTYRASLPEQDLLFPPSLRDGLPEDHLAYFVSDVVEQLDRSAIESVYEEEERGQPPYHPRMMTKLLIYGYGVGVFSSRRRQKKLTEDVGFRVLAAGNEPDFRTLSDFRTRHLGALQGLFDQVLQIAFAGGDDEAGAGGVGWEQSESQGEQAQGDELRADAGRRKALTRRSAAVMGAGRSRG